MSSFIVNVLTILYNFLRTLILFLISKNNDLVQSEQQNWSYSIPQLVHFWFDKLSPPSEVMHFCESWWMIFQYLYTLFLISISLFLMLTGAIWYAETYFLLSTRYFIFSYVLFILLICFSIGLIVRNCFSPSLSNQNNFSFFY